MNPDNLPEEILEWHEEELSRAQQEVLVRMLQLFATEKDPRTLAWRMIYAAGLPASEGRGLAWAADQLGMTLWGFKSGVNRVKKRFDLPDTPFDRSPEGRENIRKAILRRLQEEKKGRKS